MTEILCFTCLINRRLCNFTQSLADHLHTSGCLQHRFARCFAANLNVCLAFCLRRIVQYTLGRHLPKGCTVTSSSNALDWSLVADGVHPTEEVAASRALDAALDKLGKQLRGLSGVALKVRRCLLILLWAFLPSVESDITAFRWPATALTCRLPALRLCTDQRVTGCGGWNPSEKWR